MSDWDAARFLPSVARPTSWYLRFGLSGHTVPVDGIFVAAHRAMEARDLEPWERDAVREVLAWFDEHLAAPNPRDSRARFFVRSGSHEMVARFWELHDLLRALGVPVEMVAVRRVGRVVVADEHQVAAVREATRGRAVIR